MGPARARGEHQRLCARHDLLDLRHRHACHPRDLGGPALDVQDALALEVPALAHIIERGKNHRIVVAQHLAQLGGRPDKEGALFAVRGIRRGQRVGVLGREEAAGRVAHLADDIVERLFGDAAIEWVAAVLERLDIDARQQRVVVEHLLEVRHQPLLVDAIAVESAAELVVHAALGHGAQGLLQHAHALLVAGALGVAQQELEGHGLGKLGGAAKAAVVRLELVCQRTEGVVEQLVAQRASGHPGGGGRADMLDQLLARVQQLASAVAIGVGDAQQHAPEGRQTMAILGRKVSAAIERHAIWRHEHCHRPAAAAGHGLNSGHIDIIDIGSLFAVDLDINEVFVH